MAVSWTVPEIASVVLLLTVFGSITYMWFKSDKEVAKRFKGDIEDMPLNPSPQKGTVFPPYGFCCRNQKIIKGYVRKEWQDTFRYLPGPCNHNILAFPRISEKDYPGQFPQRIAPRVRVEITIKEI